MQFRTAPVLLALLLGLGLLSQPTLGRAPPPELLLSGVLAGFQLPPPGEIPASSVVDAPTLEDILSGRWRLRPLEILADPPQDLLSGTSFPPPQETASALAGEDLSSRRQDGPVGLGDSQETSPSHLEVVPLPSPSPEPASFQRDPATTPEEAGSEEAGERRPGTVRIASWNMLNLSRPRELERRAEVIAHFDLVALQEVKRPATLNKLRKVLQQITGVTWHREVSERVGKGQKAECLAFLYRTDRVKPVKGKNTKGILRPQEPGSFSRPPFYATFRAGKFDFVILSYHARWGKGSEITREVSLLGDLYRRLSGALGNEKDVIIAGDFNRDRPTHPAFYSLEQAGMRFLVEDLEGAFTTYSDKPGKIGASFYDNLWAPEAYTREFTGSSGVVYPHELFFQDQDHPHLAVRTAISDHCPVWAEFSTTEDDD